jgi:hypothetical protein
MEATWRERAAPIIHEIIERVGTDDMKALRKAIREAYPFGLREYWPYKVWLSEVRDQLRSRRLQIANGNQRTLPLFPDYE